MCNRTFSCTTEGSVNKNALMRSDRWTVAFEMCLLLHVNGLCLDTYTAHAVAFAAIRTTRTREHFAESSYKTQLRVQTMHNTRIVLPVASMIAQTVICLGC